VRTARAPPLQEAEWFGTDCSKRHCPSGDNRDTAINETNGVGINCANSTEVAVARTGAAGNKCHYDCSGRGSCDFATGICDCFPGYGSSSCYEYDIQGYSIDPLPAQ
jgi:hypothetical protein